METKLIKVAESDHREIKTQAAKAGVSMMAFISQLVKAWKGKK